MSIVFYSFPYSRGRFCLHALYEELYNSRFWRFVSLCICPKPIICNGVRLLIRMKWIEIWVSLVGVHFQTPWALMCVRS